MLTSLWTSFRREYQNRRMARFAVWVVLYGVALWFVDRVAGGVPGLLWFLFWLCILLVALYYLGRASALVRQRLLWRLRQRLIVTYLFIAVVPILLILVLVGLGAFIINGQFAAFLVVMRLRNHFDELRQLNRVVVHEAHQVSAKNAEALLDRLQKFYVTELSEHAASYPGLEVTIQVGSMARAFDLRSRLLAKPLLVPSWLTDEEFAGMVLDEGQIDLRALARTRTSAGNLVIILSQPFTPELLDLVGAGVGPVGVLTTRGERVEASLGSNRRGLWVKTPEGQRAKVESIRSKSVSLPRRKSLIDFTVFGATPLDLMLWTEGSEQHAKVPIFVYVSSRIVALNQQILATLGEFSRVYVVALAVVAVIFFLIELFALIIGIQLTRSIITTVDQLHAATERVKAGDLSYRIRLPARDQLSALGEAFDNMTASLARLLRESQEKLRLESEIEIARDVQRQLFPQAPPQVSGLQLYGICKPARAVSGDYYDFLRVSRNRVGLVLGDVSGKGISAALLMATIQAALHAQLYDGHLSWGVSDLIAVSTAEIVARLNRQLFESTPAEQYATFFFAVYDEKTRMLTYTNAGHVPPLLLRPEGVERLESGGTVVGLFSSMSYEQAEIELRPNDVLLAFTDGVTEPENSYGEQFGEARVIEVAQHALNSPLEVLVEEICRSVSDWTGSPELQDDMTLLAAKAVA